VCYFSEGMEGIAVVNLIEGNNEGLIVVTHDLNI
jgi:hypothetical protein